MDAYFLINHAEVERYRLLKIFVVVIYCLVFIAIPFICIELYREGLTIRVLAPLFGFIFFLMTLPISIYDIMNHFKHFHKPELQKFLVRIILMIPIYSLTACMSLTFSLEWERYLESFRGLYEAYVIWSFTYFLMAFLGPSEADICLRLSTKQPQPHLLPFNICLRTWAMGEEFLYFCKIGTLQYVVWKTFAVVLSIFMVIDFSFSPLRASFWIVIITSASQMLAIYCLVLFYMATKQDLSPINPFLKFACIKAVIFFSFWQQVLISLLVQLGVLKSTEFLTASGYGSEIQDFIICFEMVLFAVAHHFAFSYADFCRYALNMSPGSRPTSLSSGRALIATADPRDLVNDIRRFSSRIREGTVTSFRKSSTVTSGTSYSNTDDEEVDGQR